MPILQNRRHGTFAQARARGARRNDAYKDAGFAGDMAERIAGLRAARGDRSGADVESVISGLPGMAKVSEALELQSVFRRARTSRIWAGYSAQDNTDKTML